MLVTLDEPLVEKPRSYKAMARVNYLIRESIIPAPGKIIIYFQKDSFIHNLSYGSRIIFTRQPGLIRNTGNPGSFNYKRYSLFKGITHQVYLGPNDFQLLPNKKQERFRQFIYKSRQKVLNILRTNIHGKKELGLAEALLIGYKDDLDKELVQSYANTGVVHIIAISGLHIGLIYWLLKFLLKPLHKRKKSFPFLRWFTPLLILTGLWLFSLLAGAQPSVLRSALMFSCIVIGENLDRKAPIFNTLAFSAFLLLCYNPYLLWDAGFQLSYAAVFSIVIFLRPIYDIIYIQNKFLNLAWKMNAVTIAAQILTLPLTIYYFHQFPNYFLLTNFIAVPLSSLILLGEILLCAIGFLQPLASIVGKCLSTLIMGMNRFVEKIESLPFAVWEGLQINLVQTTLLFLCIAGAGYWLMERSKPGLKLFLFSFLGFSILRSYSFIYSENQEKIIVYNIPRTQAIDFIRGRSHLFAGDSDSLNKGNGQAFYLKPSRILHRVREADSMPGFYLKENIINFQNKKVLVIDKSVRFPRKAGQLVIDLVIVSKKGNFNTGQLNSIFKIRQIVFDASSPAWKLKYWKKDCDSLQIPYHDIREKGAFVMNLD